MNRRTLTAVAIATVIALIAAVATHRSQKGDSEVTSNADLLLPQLASHLDEVTNIKLSSVGQNEIASFKPGAMGWLVGNRSDYPADAGKLRAFVLQLSNAKTIEAKTKNPALYPKLGVDEVTAPNAAGVLVEIDGLPQKIAVIVGNVNGGDGGGTFVRRMGDEQSWLIGGTLTVDRSTSDWIAKEIVDLASSRVREVVIEQEGKTLRVSRPAGSDGNFEIDDVSKGRKPTSEFAANGLASTLAGLRVDDVTAAAQMPAPADAIKAHYLTIDGIRVDATAWTASDRHYAQFKASVDDADASTDEAASAAALPSEPAVTFDRDSDHVDKQAAVRDEVDRLNAVFDGWTFTIPGYKFDTINKSMDDLLLPLDAAKLAPAKPAKLTRN